MNELYSNYFTPFYSGIRSFNSFYITLKIFAMLNWDIGRFNYTFQLIH